MDDFDALIRAALHRAADQAQPPDDLLPRVLASLPPPRRRAARRAAVVAGLSLATLLPLVRPAVVGLTQSAGAAQEAPPRPGAAQLAGAPPRTPPENAAVRAAVPPPVLRFSGPPGVLPPAARAALAHAGAPWRIPRWLPPDRPVRVTLAGTPPAAVLAIALEGRSGRPVVIQERLRAGSTSGAAPEPSAAQVPETLRGRPPLLETWTPATVTYRFRTGRLAITVSGPADARDLVRRVVAGLVP
ncbi:MAG: hypothetical protein K6V97_08930 [Actinomycetia bacterium]|nr:hypothetical protein [Actinomycetes bacterium]